MNMHWAPRTSSSRPRQRGAAALEFALLFMIFFAVLYAIIGYSLMLMVKHGFTQAASEAARAAVRIDQLAFSTLPNYQSAVNTVARNAAINALDWLPPKALAKVKAGSNISTTWATGTQVVTTGGTPLTITTRTLTVTIRYLNYAGDPLLPSLTLGDLGSVPPLPRNLIGQSSIQLQL